MSWLIGIGIILVLYLLAICKAAGNADRRMEDLMKIAIISFLLSGCALTRVEHSVYGGVGLTDTIGGSLAYNTRPATPTLYRELSDTGMLE